MLQAERRAHHNALERKRRDHIKESFTSLRDSVPNLSGEKVKVNSKGFTGLFQDTRQVIFFLRPEFFFIFCYSDSAWKKVGRRRENKKK